MYKYMYNICMPTIFKVNKIKFAIYTNDHEPAHVHVMKDGAEVVVEIMSGKVVRNKGFSKKAVGMIIGEILDNQKTLMIHWENIHGKK